MNMKLQDSDKRVYINNIEKMYTAKENLKMLPRKNKKEIENNFWK